MSKEERMALRELMEAISWCLSIGENNNIELSGGQSWSSYEDKLADALRNAIRLFTAPAEGGKP